MFRLARARHARAVSLATAVRARAIRQRVAVSRAAAVMAARAADPTAGPSASRAFTTTTSAARRRAAAKDDDAHDADPNGDAPADEAVAKKPKAGGGSGLKAKPRTKHERIAAAKVGQRARRAEKEEREAEKEARQMDIGVGSKGNELDAADARKALEQSPRTVNALVLHPVIRSNKTATLLVDEATRHSQRLRGTDGAVDELLGLVEAANFRIAGAGGATSPLASTTSSSGSSGSSSGSSSSADTHPTRSAAVAAAKVDATDASPSDASNAVVAQDANFARPQAVMTLPLHRLIPATLFGEGQIKRIAHVVADINAVAEAAADKHGGTPAQYGAVEVCVVDSALTPTQQRNLESVLAVPVFDRTQLILHIFGLRARSSEAKMQVELATLQHKKSRLVRSHSAHYAQQRASGSGGGFLAGSGETQLEIDSRVLSDRIRRLQQSLATVAQHRARQRAARKHMPVVAVVGYTNAGKSALVNRLTGAHLLTQNRLFATLDATARGVTLPSGRRALLVDTVGFVSQLPHELVMAFRATLEEVIDADVLLHVRDIPGGAADAQRTDVLHVLSGLGVGSSSRGKTPIPVVEVWNKCDLMHAAEADAQLTERRVELKAAAEAVALAEAAGKTGAKGGGKAATGAGAGGDKTVSRQNKEHTIKFHARSTADEKSWQRSATELDALTRDVVLVSALHGTGTDNLLVAIDKALDAAGAGGGSAAVSRTGAATGTEAVDDDAAGGATTTATTSSNTPAASVTLALDLSRPHHAKALDWLYARDLIRARTDGAAAAGGDAMPLDAFVSSVRAANAAAAAAARAGEDPDLVTASATPSAVAPEQKKKRGRKPKAAAAAVAKADAVSAIAEPSATTTEGMGVSVTVWLDAETRHRFAELFAA